MRKKILLSIVIVLLIFNLAYAQEAKQCEFAGSFYPQDKTALSSLVDDFLASANPQKIDEEILGIVSPHAGYIYSGPIAAYSYKAIQDKKFDTVIILAPSHQHYLDGVAIYSQGYFQSPLGNLEIDSELAAKFSSLDLVTYDKKYFNGEHAIEVQLPYVIKALSNPKIVPIIFGKNSYEQLEKFAEKLKELSSSKKILIIVSTDMSHYRPYQEAIVIDKSTYKLIEKKDSYGLWSTQEEGGGRACGIYPLITFVFYAQIQDAAVKILKYANSGDTAGDKNKVVGYMSAVAVKNSPQSIVDSPQKEEDRSQKPEAKKEKVEENKEENMGEFNLNNEEKQVLLKIARETLENHLQGKKVPSFKIGSNNLKEKRGAFVTLKEHGELRGCIGRIVADEVLYKVISQMAIEAATGDPRFSPVQYAELKNIEIEISVLTPFVEVKSLDEIEVGKHGLMIRKGFYSGLLLPQVPGEWGWDKQTFLEQTCHKAGLPTNAYKDKSATLYKFSAIVFGEKEER